MSIAPAKIASARRTLWHRVRFQLGAGLLLAVAIPYFLRLQLEYGQSDVESLNNSLLGTVAALLLGYYAFRRVSHYPGVRASYHILPSFAASFGLALAVFFFARLDYSRLHFLASFVLCVGWYYVVYFKLQRQQRLRIGVVPAGDVEHLFGIPEVAWVRLDAGSREQPCDAIVADLRADMPDEWERFLADRALAGTLVMHVKQMEESLTGRVAIEHLSENTLGSLIPGIVYAKIKRLSDIVVSIAALPVLIPLFAILAILIRLDSPGPIFFRQERMGYRGHPFRMWKFRTMRHGHAAADAREAAMTRDGDDRVTKIGRPLRRYRIDELPQVINILKGEMSWIGPRPEAVPLSLWYEAELPFYRYRHIVRPGITGWAQVKQGHVAEVEDVLWKLHYDFYYIKNFSFWLDVLIVAGTMKTVFSGFGAR
ncbi:sugar transferase [Sphingosinicella sp. BN140058]|uniref:sugar transferase n=1 Tax=Sphingosinicella sp. BN140058 TaxID=1892855 RepID=UPI001013906B|nr:sugar transferase [Sphingosinicella sp. BN140058]QAY77031.1 polyprenyl glycosylphosphotransferase [Sphingosinicella sp. BN140058]